MRIVSVDEFLCLPRPTLDWLIYGIIPRPSQCLLMGAPKEGKTFLAVDLANCVASGRDFLGHAVEPGRVLYIQLDDRLPVWHERLAKLKEGGFQFHPNFLVVHEGKRPLNILLPDTQTYLKTCMQAAQPDLVVIDTFRKLHNADENDSTEMKQVGDKLEELFKGVALLLLHHTRKIPAETQDPDPAQSGRGSSYITGDPDALLLLHGGRLKLTTRFDENGTYSLKREESGLWSRRNIHEMTEQAERAMALCVEFPNMPHAKLAGVAKERHGMSRATFYRALAGRQCAHRLSRETR